MAIENIGLYPITIDVYNKHKETTVYANDNDLNGRGLLINLVKNNSAFDSTGIALKIGFRNAVGEERLYDCDIVDALIGQYKVFYPTEMLSGNGGRVVKLEIKAYEGTGALLNYAPLFVYVNASEIPDDALGGMNEVSTLTQAILDVETFKPQMETFLIESDAAIETSVSNANAAINSAITAANNANTATTSANNKIVDVENRFTALTASQQADAEVIDARQGELSLGANLTKFSAQLADIENVSALTKSGLVHEYLREDFSNVDVSYTSGYWFQNSANDSADYYYTNKFQVQKGDIITASYFGNPQVLRFIDVYNGNSLISSISVETTSFTVPEGADGLIVTVYSAGIADKIIHKKNISTNYTAKIDRKNFVFEANAESLAVNTDLIAAKRIDNKKNCSYLFTGFFSSFGTLKIGHGKTEYGAVYMTIDATNIKTYSHTGSLFQTFPHGLTIKDFISVNIKVADDFGARAVVTLRTNGGEFIVSNVIFFGSNGDVYANSTVQMTKAKFQFVVNDMKKDIFIFGDSYISLADNQKWPYYLLNNGYTNMLLNGFGGATSLNAITAFNNIMAVQRPKYLIWLLGMNDPDTTVINANWKTTVDTVIAYCDNYDIELILATIPNTPTVKNTIKNEYVRASGHRYVDFAKAVNAEAEGASWYTGMLSPDNVHPSIEGAKALASRILIDVPELTAQ